MISVSSHRRMMTIDGLNAVSMMHAGRLGLAANWWDPNNVGLCVWSAYQPKGAASFAGSLVDLSGNGNNAGDPGGLSTPAWDAVNGWKFAGPGFLDYLTTTFVAQNDQSQSMLVQFSNVSTVGAPTSFLAGARNVADPGTRFYLGPTRTVPDAVLYGNGLFTSTVPELGAGNLAVAGNQGYRNGAVDGGAIGAFTHVPISPVWIGCQNLGGGGINWLTGYIQALAIYDCALTAPQVAAIAAAMAAL